MRFEHRSVTQEKVSLLAKINATDGPFMKFPAFKVPVSDCEVWGHFWHYRPSQISQSVLAKG